MCIPDMGTGWKDFRCYFKILHNCSEYNVNLNSLNTKPANGGDHLGLLALSVVLRVRIKMLYIPLWNH